MRARWLSLAVSGLMVLTGCTIQVVNPESPESQAPSSIASTEAAKSKTPVRTQPDPTPTEPMVADTGDETGQCPGSIELPPSVDSRACGPVPDGATNGGRGEQFITPSGNIACQMNEEGVMCEALETVMIEDFYEAGGDGECNGFVLIGRAEYLCHSEPALWDGRDTQPKDWRKFAYGEAVFVFDHVCAVEDDGLTCWNSDTGHGFLLSRARYTHW